MKEQPFPPFSAATSPSKQATQTITANMKPFVFSKQGNDLVHQYDSDTKLAIFPERRYQDILRKNMEAACV
jgi:hypothetical protein